MQRQCVFLVHYSDNCSPSATQMKIVEKTKPNKVENSFKWEFIEDYILQKL